MRMGNMNGKLVSTAAMALCLGGLLAGFTSPAHATPPEKLMSKLHWRSIGPWVGGRVVAVTGVAQDPNLFYMGTVGGGIWKSTDYGLQWTNISDKSLPGPSSSIGAIAVAPSDPTILYAGTGECDIRNDMIPGDGVYKSTDGGKTWQYAGLRDAHTTCSLAVDPKNPNLVYAASMGQVFTPNSEGGVYKTEDGGKTWTKILAAGTQLGGAIDLVMEPAQPEVLYAAIWQAQRMPWGMTDGGPASGLYKSTNGGKTWTDLIRHPGMPAGVIGRIGVAVTAADPQVVYAMVEAVHGGLFRSADGGATWKRVNKEWQFRERPFYYSAVYADPRNADVVYAPAIGALWMSRDGGNKFERLHPPHGDNHIVWINPNDTRILLEGNDGGATVSTDGGKSWSDEHNQPTGEMYHVNIDDEFPYHIYGAQQDEGSAEAPSANPGGISAAAWKQVAGGEATRVVPMPGKPWINFGSDYFELFTAKNRRTGNEWDVTPQPDMHDGEAADAMPDRFGWTHAISFSPVNPNELLVGAQYVFESLDAGRTWKRISPDLTRNDPATEVASGGPITYDQTGAETYPGLQTIAVSPLDGNVIWAGSGDGLAHVTRNGGGTWQNVTPPQLPQRSWISCIEPSHAAAGTAFLTARRYMWNDFRPYVYKTTDYGQTWTPIVNGLSDDTYVFDLRQDPAEPNLLFLGTNSTVEVSLNGGALWQSLKLDLPNVQVRDLRINDRQGEVAIATHGRAFWILDDLSLLEQMSRNSQAGATSPYLFAPATAWLSPAYGGGRGGRAGMGENPPFGATVYFSVPSAYNGSTPATLTFTDAAGKTIRSFQLHLKKPGQRPAPGAPFSFSLRQAERRLTAITPGMNRFQWDLRYPPAPNLEGTAYRQPQGVGVPYSMNGPVITPGQYNVTLEYGGQKQSQSFQVTLDPRLHATSADLQAKLALELEMHQTLTQLDTSMNRALALRTRLRKDSGADHTAAIAGLTQAIDGLEHMQLRGDETDAAFGTGIHLHLAFLAGEVAEGYRRPTPAEYAAYKYLAGKIAAAEKTLQSAMTTATAN